MVVPPMRRGSWRRWGEEDAYSAPADNWVRAHPINPALALMDKAVTALDRIVVPPSELLELWQETAEAEAWVEVVHELRVRLTA